MLGMTGYSFKETQIDGAIITTEIKTINSKFLDLFVNLPSFLNSMDLNIRNLIKDKFNRGKIEINVTLKLKEKTYNVNADLKLAKQYIDTLNKIITNFNLRDEVKLFHLTRYEDVIFVEQKKDYNKYWKLISKCLLENIEEVIEMRKKEGEDIKKDIFFILKRIKKNVDIIEKKIPKMEKETYEKSKKKVMDLIGNNIDEIKLLNEVAFLVTKSCINEEAKRLNIHIEQFIKILDEKNGIGKKLDFVCQELHREINTVGSKISLVELTTNVITIKNDIEKLREHIRNIE